MSLLDLPYSVLLNILYLEYDLKSFIDFGKKNNNNYMKQWISNNVILDLDIQSIMCKEYMLSKIAALKILGED